MSEQFTPFHINIKDDQLEDLKRRRQATRWPERECVDDWMQGLPLGYAQGDRLVLAREVLGVDRLRRPSGNVLTRDEKDRSPIARSERILQKWRRAFLNGAGRGRVLVRA
jgi:hypothetical protein